MSLLSNNIKLLRKGLGFTQEELAEKVGITRSILGSYEEGRAEPKLQTLQNIAQYFKVSIDDLLSKEISSVTPAMVDTKGSGLRILPIVVTQDDKELINVVPNKAIAGYLNGYSDKEYIQDLSCFNLPVHEISPNRTYRIFQIKGDSMLPIPSDAYIISQYIENWELIKDNDSYIVLTKDDGVVFKRVSNRISERNEVLLTSDNPAYPPYSIKIDSVLEIWKAVGYICFQLPKGSNDLSLERLSNLVLELQKDLSAMKGAE